MRSRSTDQLQHLRTEQWTEWTTVLQARWRRIPNNIWQIYIDEKEPQDPVSGHVESLSGGVQKSIIHGAGEL